MRAPLAEQLRAAPYAHEAVGIVRSCVHCGFCNATCPTYQLSGDEREGPRGRIYLIKALLEDDAAGATTRLHLDHCLVCRNCETTCPSGVRYGRLLELVRPLVYTRAGLPLTRRLLRWLLLHSVPYPRRLRPLVALGRFLRPLLPRRRAHMLAAARELPPTAPARHPRRVLLLGGCAQAVLEPAIDASARRVFDAAGFSLITVAGADCCGALAHHLGAEQMARATARANLDAWQDELARGAEAVLATASACALQLKEYAALLADDPEYAARAAQVAALARDPVELIEPAAIAGRIAARADKVAVQTPCSLQHGQRLDGRIERLLSALGYTLGAVGEAHLCCGSAGAHAIFEPHTAARLGERKLANLLADRPQVIVTANIGCQLHLGSMAPVPVKHWLELLAEDLVAA